MFADAVGKAGFAAVDAMPMKLRSDAIGALALFRAGIRRGTAGRAGCWWRVR